MSHRLFLRIFVAMASLLLIAPLRAADWQTGTYTYDLSGNITAIGTHTFAYLTPGSECFEALHGAYVVAVEKARDSWDAATN